MAVSDSRQAGTIEVTPAMIEAGVFALIHYYDRNEDGLDNSRLTVSAIIAAVFKHTDHFMNLDGGFARELS